MWSLSILSFMVLPGDSHEDSNGASSSSLFTRFLLRWIQIKLLVLISHPFSSFQMCSYGGAPHNHSPLAIQLFRSAEDISEDLCLHYQSVQDILRLLSLLSHLIQPVQSLFSSNLFNGVSFEWALTHMYFSRILPDSSFSGVILKFFSKFDIRMNYHQSYVFFQDLITLFIVGSTSSFLFFRSV